ncbi:MAG: ATP-dependent zinc protease [Acidobacteria bacterium]|nr:MAG: ATP-dependent zinc protease [Acidobacteriota bacterium]REK11278.1 MAG: ATP-dependent zinc protease [Acidobacteriota bacterium]
MPSTSQTRSPDAAEERRAESSEAPTVIGWRERVSLPDWGLFDLRAKADTGARSSALDVSSIEETDDGRKVRFTVIADRAGDGVEKVVEAPIVRHTHVRSSFGRRARRIFVRTRVVVAGREFVTEIGLVDRSKMLCRMLLGRRSLQGRFLVDSRSTYLHGRRRTRER